MRCQKCGYISFDHLSECKSCGVDLKAVRDELGYFPVEPSMLPVLESLLKGQDDTFLEAGAKTQSRQSHESSSPDFELNEVFELDTIELAPDTENSPPIAPAPAQAEMKGHLDSALKVFQDIESLNDSPGESKTVESEKDFEFEIDFVLDDLFLSDDAAKPGYAPKAPAKSQTAMEPAELSLEMPRMETVSMSETIPEISSVELSDEDLDQIVLDADLEKELDLQIDFDDVPPAQAKVPEKVDPVVKSVGGKEDGMVLEISEDDLENLILELEDSEDEK